MPEFLFTPAPNRDAQRFLKAKPAVSREVFDGLLPDLRARAFTVMGVESASVLKKLRNRIADLPAGGDWDAIKGDVAAELSPYLGDEQSATRRAELLLRMHGYQSYSAGHYQVMQRQTDVFPFWEYSTANDDGVRPAHAALDGKILPANSPFWRSHFPPWEWGCRCNVIARSADDVAEIETAERRRPPEARRVVRDERLQRIEEGTLMTEENGVPRAVDVRGPREKFGGSGYHFDPSTLRLSLEEIKARYEKEPEVWATFEAWARATQIPDQGRTVWEWLSGEKNAE